MSYDVKKEIFSKCEEHKIVFSDPKEWDKLEATDLLPLVDNELNKFLEKAEYNKFDILVITDPNNKEAKYPLKISYQGGKEQEPIDTSLRMDVLTLLAQRERAEATESLVKNILLNNKIYTTRSDDKEEVFIYDDGIYKPQGKTYIKEFIRKVLDKAYTNQIFNEVLAKIEADTFIDKEEFFNTNNVWEIPVQNGVLNLKTRELSEFTPKKIFFNKLPMKYDKEALCPAIDKHFEGVLASPEDVMVMEETFGMSLCKDNFIEKAIMGVGKGRNGKGKTDELRKRFVGAENCSAVPLKNMREDGFYVYQMYNKLVNLSGDLSNTSLKETGCFKGLVGRDIISGDRKNKEHINFVNHATIVFAANELPKVYDTTDGFWDKWVLFEFQYKFITQAEYDSLPEKERADKKIIDPDHINKISNLDELSGLLNKALDGLDRLRENKGYSYSNSAKDIRDFWVRKSNSFAAFCMDCVEEDVNGFVTRKDLRAKYGKYNKILKLRNETDKSLKYTLETEFGSSDEIKYIEDMSSGTLEKSQHRGWTGIRIKDNYSEFIDNLKISKIKYGFSTSIGNKISIGSSKKVLNLTNSIKEDNSPKKYIAIENVDNIVISPTESVSLVSGTAVELNPQIAGILIADKKIMDNGI